VHNALPHPGLLPKEKENGCQSVSESCGVKMTVFDRWLFLLPGGEGRDEGEPKIITGKTGCYAPTCPLLIMDVKLPKLGEGADSGVVVNVFVKEGDQIARDQAILELEMALNQYAEDETILKLLAGLYERKQNFVQAAQLYQRAASLRPTDKDLSLKVCRCLVLSGDRQRALECYKDLLARYPGDDEIRREFESLKF